MDISKTKCPSCSRQMELNRAYCPVCDVSLDGEFEISPLGRLPLEDQLFVVAFLRTHGSIKKMEGLFGISYPTVKNRLNALTAELDKSFEAPTPSSVILDQLARGEISVDEALEGMS